MGSLSDWIDENGTEMAFEDSTDPITDICYFGYGVELASCQYECICSNINSSDLNCAEWFNGTDVNVINDFYCAQSEPLDYSNSVYVAYALLGLVIVGFLFYVIKESCANQIGDISEVADEKSNNGCVGKIINALCCSNKLSITIL
mgnify:CR=1 FL=1